MSEIQSNDHAASQAAMAINGIERMTREYKLFLNSHGNVGGWEEDDFMRVVHRDIIRIKESLVYLGIVDTAD